MNLYAPFYSSGGTKPDCQDCQDCHKPTAGRVDGEPICFPCLDRRRQMQLAMDNTGLEFRIWSLARAVVLLGRVDLLAPLQRLIQSAPLEIKKRWSRLLAHPDKVRSRWSKLE